jgi:hypothetical protein
MDGTEFASPLNTILSTGTAFIFKLNLLVPAECEKLELKNV